MDIVRKEDIYIMHDTSYCDSHKKWPRPQTLLHARVIIVCDDL